MKPQAGTLYWVALIKSKRFGNAAAKTTMFVLADYVGGEDECHPGVDRVAAETELSAYQARKALGWLKEAGLLQQTRRVNSEGHRIENGLVLDRDGVLALPDVIPLDAKTAPRPSAVLRSAPSAVLGESPSANSLPEIADKASQEPPIEPKSKSSATETVAKPTDDPLVAEARKLAMLAFEQDVKPVIRSNGSGPFPAVMGLIESQLRACQPPARLASAIRAGVDVWTTAGLQTAIAKSRGSPKARRQQETLDIAADYWRNG